MFTCYTKEAIDSRCKAQGMSRREMCRRAGVNCRTVENWCAGTRKTPEVYQLWRVARALGCQIEELLDPARVEEQPTE